MIGSTRRVRVLAYTAPTDMRRGFDGLSSMVSTCLGHDPLSGDLYLFVARNRKRAKVLLWDGTGLCLYAKRLEQGQFAALWERGRQAQDGTAVGMTMSELALFLEGSHLVGKQALSPPPFVLGKRRQKAHA